jgi:hypothetical protein
MMRRILVTHAEARHAQKRDGGFRVPLDDQLEQDLAAREPDNVRIGTVLQLAPGILRETRN